MRRTALLLAAFVSLLAGRGSAETDWLSWSGAARPSAGRAESIGGYANGCIAGAVPLPSEGAGYQVIRLSRNRFYGNPGLIRFVEDLGRRVAGERLGAISVGDLSQPRGGPMPSGHASHQIGLDADIWLRLDLGILPPERREDLEEINMIAPARREIDPVRFGRQQARLIQLAAEDPRVARIFVAPGIKLALCRIPWQDRAALGKVRPWYGHTGHMHVRLNCPKDDVFCRAQDEVPAGDGCGAELMSWFKPLPKQSTAPTPPRRRPSPPDECDAVLSAPAPADVRRR